MSQGKGYGNQLLDLCIKDAKEKGAVGLAAQALLIKIKSTEVAQNAPTPFTTYSFFYDGKFVTNEILTEKKFLQFLEKHGM